MLSVGYYFSY